MNKQIIILVGVVVLSIAVVGVVLPQLSTKPNTGKMAQVTAPLDTSSDAMQKEQAFNDNQTVMDNNSAMKTSGSYIVYTPQAYEAAANTKRVLFFHATWCPTCKTANEEFNSSPEAIPNGITLLKTDYDKETALKSKYAITYQHTFVQVDENGNAVSTWNGGGIKELTENVK